jgi:hypothetical protein
MLFYGGGTKTVVSRLAAPVQPTRTAAAAVLFDLVGI